MFQVILHQIGNLQYERTRSAWIIYMLLFPDDRVDMSFSTRHTVEHDKWKGDKISKIFA